MSGAAVHLSIADDAATRRAGGVRARLSAVCLAHAAVDLFSALVIPVLSVLEGRLSLTPAEGAALVGVSSLCSGAVQPLVAWLSDRFDTRVFGVLGLAVAAAAIGSIGWARTYAELLALVVVGSAGVGAFHPVCAAAVGQLSGARRSIGVAAFFTAGMAGGIAGFWGAPLFVSAFGVRAYAWLIPGAMVAAAALAWATLGVGHRHPSAHDHHSALDAHERRRRWGAVWLLFAGNALRFTANMALVYLLVRWAEAVVTAGAGAGVLDGATRAQASRLNGPLQAAMAIGMGVSGLAAGFARTRHEKAALIAVPLLGAAVVAWFPHAGRGAAYTLAVLAGVGYAGVIPITIALAQRLLPHRTSLASGLMMGGAWSLAAAGPPLTEWVVSRAGLAWGFYAAAAVLAFAGLLGVLLPRELIEGSAREGLPGRA